MTEDLGELELELTVTDAGTPPESDSVDLVFNLLDDNAIYTRLVGTIVQGENSEAWLYDPATDDRTLYWAQYAEPKLKMRLLQSLRMARRRILERVRRTG